MAVLQALALGVSLGSSVLGSRSQRKANRAMRRGALYNFRAGLLRSFGEQRTLLRQGQLAASSSAQDFLNSGAGIDSSAARGVGASIYTQLMDSFLLGESINALQGRAAEQGNQAAAFQSQASTIIGAGQLGSAVLNNLDLFAPPPSAPPPATVPSGGGTVTVGDPVPSPR